MWVYPHNRPPCVPRRFSFPVVCAGLFGRCGKAWWLHPSLEQQTEFAPASAPGQPEKHHPRQNHQQRSPGRPIQMGQVWSGQANGGQRKTPLFPFPSLLYSTASIYAWRRKYIQKGAAALMNPPNERGRGKLIEEKAASLQEIGELKAKIQDMQTEIDQSMS